MKRTLMGLAVGLTVAAWATPALAQNNLLADVQRVRAQYPAVMSEAQKAELLNQVAWQHRAEGWGLLRKDGGARCPAPQGVFVACDILVYQPTAWHFDVLIDGQIPAWIDDGPCVSPPSGCSMSRFLLPVPPPGQTGMGDAPVAGEYDGDGRPDVAVYRTTTGEWFIAQSSGGSRVVPWGGAGDIPMPADYDGDHRTDIAVFRPSTAQWFIINSSTNAASVWTFGSPSSAGLGDTPLAGDADGDGRSELGIYRQSTGDWFIRRSSDGGTTTIQWGAPGDVPVPGEYDGDGRPDVAVYRVATGEWFIAQSGGGGRVVAWGSAGDIPMPADYDGDDRTDVAVFRPSTAQWFIINSSTNTSSVLTFGAPASTGLRDGPLAGDYDRDGRADLGIYRFSTGEWFIRRSSDGGTTTIQWGAP